MKDHCKPTAVIVPADRAMQTLDELSERMGTCALSVTSVGLAKGLVIVTAIPLLDCRKQVPA